MHYDLVVVGGGLVGASLVCALADLPLNIALIDAKVPTLDDARLFGLNYSSCQFLKNLGVWSSLASHVAPIHEVHVSHQGRFGAVRLKREDVSLSELGHVVPAYLIESALNEKLASQSNVTLYQPASLQQLSQQQTHVDLTIVQQEKTQHLTANWVVGADGAQSTVRQLVNIQSQVNDYQQTALVMRTTLQKEHVGIAYERFTATGAIAMLPLPGREYATIWTLDNDQLPAMQALSDAAFRVQLQKEFGYKLGKFLQVSARHQYPLRQTQAEKSVEKNVLLLGNALHALHPIAAQGLNLALYEVAVLVDAVNDLARQGLGMTAVDLEKFSLSLEKQQAMSVGASHRLSQWFLQKSMGWQMMLQCGMLGFDLITPLKRKWITAMLARSSRVPRLLLDTY